MAFDLDGELKFRFLTLLSFLPLEETVGWDDAAAKGERLLPEVHVGDAFCAGIEEELAILSLKPHLMSEIFLSPPLLIRMTGCTDPGATSSSALRSAVCRNVFGTGHTYIKDCLAKIVSPDSS
jgi:hypothetical protein